MGLNHRITANGEDFLVHVNRINAIDNIRSGRGNPIKILNRVSSIGGLFGYP